MEKKISPNLTLFALAINAFAIGSTEFISVGLLPMIVKSFHISLSQAGLTVSLYALGVTIGAPLLTILTGKWNRRSLMLGIMLLFISGNLIAAFAPTFIILLVGRILSALAHGIFMSVYMFGSVFPISPLSLTRRRWVALSPASSSTCWAFPRMSTAVGTAAPPSSSSSLAAWPASP